MNWTDSPHVEKAVEYARAVVSGATLACKWARLACQRFLNDLQGAEEDGYPYAFDTRKAERACKFIELLPHVKGKWAGKRLKLEPWQCFIVVNLFGWVYRVTGLRRFRKAFILVPRKNGKSPLAAAIGLYMLALDGEAGAEVYCGASTEKQAWEVFRSARLMAERTPEFCTRYGVEINAKTVCIPGNGSRFEPVVGKPGDGASVSCGIADEFHEHKTNELVETYETGMMAREQPLLLMISTAGVDTAGPCYQTQLDAQAVLEGVVSADELFALIYTIDEGDDWTIEEALRKANPNYGVSVLPENILIDQRAAIQSSRKQAIFRTKHLNVWSGAREPFFNAEEWRRLTEPDLIEDQFAGNECWCGMDLASKIDIASCVRLYRREIDGEWHYYPFATHYLPEERVDSPDTPHYKGWEIDGYLVATPGNVIDHRRIREDWQDRAREMDVQALGFDPYNAAQLVSELQEDGLPMVEVPQRWQHLSDPMKWLDALIQAGRIHPPVDPVMAWMIANVTAKPDANENVFPRKERPENKIDGAVALIIAMGRALVDEGNGRSVYESRGIEYL